MSSKTRILAGLLTGLALVFGAGQARADILLIGSSAPGTGGNTVYTYNVFLTPGSQLIAGGGGDNPFNLVTLYDFPGLIGAPALSPTLDAIGDASVQLVGITPPTQNPTDVNTISNITVTFTPPGPIAVAPTGTNLLLGSFSLTSSFGPGTGTDLQYSAATQRFDDPLALANNTSETLGPVAGPTPPEIPEPASAALLLAGVPLLWAARRFRKKAAA